MKFILGAAKCCALFWIISAVYTIFLIPLSAYFFMQLCSLMYLHEGLKPKVVQREIESTNISLHRCWNAKLSDFVLPNPLGSERSNITIRSMDLSMTLVVSLLVIFLLAFSLKGFRSPIDICIYSFRVCCEFEKKGHCGISELVHL
ncbi:unnamed protein product [Urochloa humidicola]